MHFDKDCGGPKNQTHVSFGQGKLQRYFDHLLTVGDSSSTDKVTIPERPKVLPYLRLASPCRVPAKKAPAPSPPHCSWMRTKI